MPDPVLNGVMTIARRLIVFAVGIANQFLGLEHPLDQAAHRLRAQHGGGSSCAVIKAASIKRNFEQSLVFKREARSGHQLRRAIRKRSAFTH